MEGKDRKTQPKSARRHSWRTLIGVAAVTLLLVGVISAITMQGEPTILKAQVAGRSSDVSKDSSKTTEAGVQKSRHYVTRDSAGQTVALDRQTGQTRPLTPAEAATLAEGIKQLVNQSTEGLVQVRRADGAVSMDLQGHFQNVLLAKKESDGTVSQSCINDLESAADFFEIDPALLGVAAPVSKSQPSSATLPIR
jgi:hypothetical protein